MAGIFTIVPPPKEKEFQSPVWTSWFTQMRDALVAKVPLAVPSYTLTTLPPAASYTGCYIDVSNATGGAKLCRSNGTNWIIANTVTIVS